MRYMEESIALYVKLYNLFEKGSVDGSESYISQVTDYLCIKILH